MENFIVTFDEIGTLDSIHQSLQSAIKKGAKALTLLLPFGNNLSREVLDPVLQAVAIPLSGGLFPKIIFQNQILDQGMLLIAWQNDITITNYKNIECVDRVKDLVGITIPQERSNTLGEYLVFLDGTVPKLEETIDMLYKKNGFRAKFVGGGAGPISMEALPCIITNEGLLSNTMQVVATNLPSKITVTHGWRKKSGPYLVTSTKNRTIKTLNYKPIVQILKNFVEQDNDTSTYNDNELLASFNCYPLGLENLDGDILIRNPVAFNDNEIDYFGNIPEYSKVHIMQGSSASLRKQIDIDLEEANIKTEKKVQAGFIFSTICRDDSDTSGKSEELKVINNHLSSAKHIMGALTLGSIATNKSGLLQLHNKSIVISQVGVNNP